MWDKNVAKNVGAGWFVLCIRQRKGAQPWCLYWGNETDRETIKAEIRRATLRVVTKRNAELKRFWNKNKRLERK